MTSETTSGDAVRVFISYSHDTSEHEDRVLLLADTLNEQGIDTIIDRYEPDPPEGWPKWMGQQAREARFVLMICTEAYFNRCEGLEVERKGQGVKWESNLFYNQLYADGTLNRKVVPVLFPDSTLQHVPTPFQGFTSYRIDPDNLDSDAGFDKLYRRLTNQPEIVKPAVGNRRTMPPRTVLPSAPAQPSANAPESTEARFETKVSGGTVGNVFNIGQVGNLTLRPPESSGSPHPPSPSSEDDKVDFVIVTAIEPERRAVCAAFGLTLDHRRMKEGRRYWVGDLPLKNGHRYRIVVAQCPGMGNANAALLTKAAVDDWKPGAVLMVGIAAAATDKQRLGDVVVGSHVYYYEAGKVTPQGVMPEAYMYPADSVLLNAYTSLADWTPKLPVARPGGNDELPRCEAAVVASGEKVVADPAFRELIVHGHRKIRAIAMEDYGVSLAVWQCFEQVRHLVIRGLCDKGDAAKNDDWHRYAAAAAADFARHFILDSGLEPRNP